MPRLQPPRGGGTCLVSLTTEGRSRGREAGNRRLRAAIGNTASNSIMAAARTKTSTTTTTTSTATCLLSLFFPICRVKENVTDGYRKSYQCRSIGQREHANLQPPPFVPPTGFHAGRFYTTRGSPSRAV